ncbi:uncharacterized protein LOC119596993 isoform X4 [Penaeus monodon]|uniref:uncharacterized protein LOC119596993 isoform X3 n=1 Tax=Penaeus monodon TaxID=6687 RepID=UPI0018A7D9D2|nr:uncharacterized protein LOC119596993 isoform X3 [Penaeus monodon]XP_037802345.1 uncharacterized protein LOC119596993 isoform X4 [Penaeus monodon]
MISVKLSFFKRYLILLLVVALGLFIYQGALPRIPQFSYWKSVLDYGRDFLSSEQKPLPWWDGGDCRCHGNSCFPEEAPSLSWEDAGGACGRRAWLAGGGQKVISFALFGNKSQYWRAFGKNLNATRVMYPDWVVWLYTNPRGRENVLCPLLRDFPHFYICDVTNLPSLGNVTSIHNMVWRTLPLGDERVSAFFVRDTDSLLLERGAAAVREWMSGNKSFHLLRDHPNHGIPVMGGLWGARWDLKTHNVSEFRKKLTGIRNALIKAAKGEFKKGVDQRILSKVLYPKTKGDVMSHDSFFCKKYPDGFRPFPKQREKGHYLGNYMGSRDKDTLIVKTPCPVACRPKNHQNWTYC